jgi:hypothetical protein
MSFQLAAMWDGKYKDELDKTFPLEEICGDLRDELDAAHKQRLDAFEVKMKPIIIRDGPSKKVHVNGFCKWLHFTLIYACR